MMSNVDYISNFCISPSWWGPLCLAVSSELPHSAIASFPVWFSSFSSGAPVLGGPSELKQPSYILPLIVEYFLPPDGLTASHSSIVHWEEKPALSGRWWIWCPICSLTCQLRRQIRISAAAGPGFWELLQPVNTVRVHPLITMHLIRMQQTSTVSCDGRTGRLRWISFR